MMQCDVDRPSLWTVDPASSYHVKTQAATSEGLEVQPISQKAFSSELQLPDLKSNPMPSLKPEPT